MDRAWLRCKTLRRLSIASFLLATAGVAPVGCSTLHPPPDPLLATIQVCSGSWGSDVSAELTANYDKLKTAGEIKWKAAVEAGGRLFSHFKDEEKALQAYDKYLVCMKPSLDKFVSTDQRPTIVLVGSREDYTTYGMSSMEATSVELLHKRFGNFKVLPLTVSYGWDNEDAIRTEKPDVIVVHASAFHSDEHKDEAIRKFQALVMSLYGISKSKFLVFSRVPPEHPTADLCQRWKRQIDFLNGTDFKDRLVFYPLARAESNFAGSAGMEVTQIVRCQSGLDATEYCAAYLSKIAEEAKSRVANSSCNAARL